MLKTTAAGIVITSLILAFNTEALDDKIQDAIDNGIITQPEGEVVQNGINDGSIEYFDVDSDDGIVVFGVIYYEDEEIEEETISSDCPIKGTHLDK
jgi:hypothetical protein